jgi:hypothetical protein
LEDLPQVILFADSLDVREAWPSIVREYRKQEQTTLTRISSQPTVHIMESLAHLLPALFSLHLRNDRRPTMREGRYVERVWHTLGLRSSNKAHTISHELDGESYLGIVAGLWTWPLPAEI